jgi:hypothetical protein
MQAASAWAAMIDPVTATPMAEPNWRLVRRVLAGEIIDPCELDLPDIGLVDMTAPDTVHETAPNAVRAQTMPAHRPADPTWRRW